jgi:fumarate hydratase subunit alpha
LDPEIEEPVNRYQGPFASILKENIEIAREKGFPLCQDTGIVEFFCFLGHRVSLEEPLSSILEKAVAETYRTYPFRDSTVQDPLFNRKPLKNNTPPMVHLFQTEGSVLEIRFLVKGGGSENLSRYFALEPSAGIEEVESRIHELVKEKGAMSCPPLHIGIGLGGSSDKAFVNAKLALTNPLTVHNPCPEYAELENRLLLSLNQLPIGFQGLGIGPTVLSVHIIHEPTHIATLPLAVATDCYLNRKGVVRFED